MGRGIDEDALAPYVAGWRARAVARREAEAAHQADVAARLPALVRRLVDGYGVRRIVLFGSHAREDARVGSDVDLLVTGLDPARLMEASAAADRILGDVHADLVPAELARPEVLARIEEEGRVLHDG